MYLAVTNSTDSPFMPKIIIAMIFKIVLKARRANIRSG